MVLDFPGKGKVKLKFLHCLSLAIYSFNWPKKDNIDTVDNKNIFAGPVKLVETGSFEIPQIHQVIVPYKAVTGKRQ